MTEEYEIEVIARRLIYDTVSSAVASGGLWDLYPDIGEFDFDRVLDHTEKFVGDINPAPLYYQAAYEILSDRADHD